MSRLTIFRDDAFLEEHVLMRAVVALGRHPENDIVLDDRTLSRFHARLERRGDRYVVVDLGAQNGVYLNGNKITGECDLVPGDRIGMGRYVAIFDQDNANPSRQRKGDGRKRTEMAMPAADGAPTMAGEANAIDIDLDEDVERAADGFDGPSASTDPHDGDSFEGPTTAVEKRAPVPTLVLLYNGLEVSRHPVTQARPLIVGRSKGCDLVISLLGLSRKHASIRAEKGGVFASDLGSQNGTWVNNVRIEGARRLAHGDLLNFYEYGILFLEDPDVQVGPATGDHAPTHSPDDAFSARETGRQDPPSVQTKPIVSKKGAGGKTSTTRRTVPLSDEDDAPSSQAHELDALDLGEGSYLGDAFDNVDDFGESSLSGQVAVGESGGTDIVKHDYVEDDDESGEGTNDFQTQTRRTPSPADELASLESETSTVRGKAGKKNARAPWPGDDELEDALSNSADQLASVDIYLGERLFTQVPLSNPVTRIGADPRCELALPPRAKLRPWHLTLVNLGGATLAVRGSKKARVRIDGCELDKAVLKDGDAMDLGTVRVVYRCR